MFNDDEPIAKRVRYRSLPPVDRGEARRQIESEQHGYREIQQRRRQTNIEHSRVVRELEDQFEGWKDGCSICRIHGRPSGSHQWKQCPERVDSVGEKIERVRVSLGEVRWENGWTCCPRCWAP